MFKIGPVKIDSLKNENTTFSNEITSKAVEGGSDIADNIRHNPLQLTATCILAGEDADERYQLLKYLSNSDELVTYYGSLEPVLYNMAIQSVSNKRDVTFGNGFEFDITLVQVNIAVAQTFQFISTATDPAIEGETQDGGKKQPEEDNVDENSIRSSIMYSALSTFGLVGG